MGLAKKLLQRRWVHSHEDDSPTTTVYRPKGYDFPPSRGRRMFELKAGGDYAQSAPGPTDQPLATSGKWRVGDDDTIVITAADGGDVRVLEVESLGRDRLVIRKKPA